MAFAIITKRLAVARELQRVGVAWVKHAAVGFPYRLMRSALADPAIDALWDEARILDLLGETTLQLFNALGPVYGKAGQLLLSRLSPGMQQVADGMRLTRLYGDWPPLEFATVADILDQEIPHWRSEFKVEHTPIGVASIGQVHAATDKNGRDWVIKIIKPQARQRLLESVAALEQIAAVVAPLAVTLVTKRFLREMHELCAGFKRELDLTIEAETIAKVGGRFKGASILKIPDLHPDFATKNVIVLERFHGVALADIVAGRSTLSEARRKKLAKNVLQDLLVQVFEVGLFHADPHAGNLILLDDDTVGLFDWGLAGELLESDRRHIAGMLKAIIAQDLERLVGVLQEMGRDAGREVSEGKIKKELTRLVKIVKAGAADAAKKPSLQQMIEQCLHAADKLSIPVPSGLLLMAKSLITIEGLARGIDPKISMARIATPVLFRAARPTFKDFLDMSRKFPSLARKLLF